MALIPYVTITVISKLNYMNYLKKLWVCGHRLRNLTRNFVTRLADDWRPTVALFTLILFITAAAEVFLFTDRLWFFYC